jgi:hypothetical protein
MIGRLPKTWAMLNVSQVGGFASAIGCDGFLCKCVELARMRITFDRCVKALGVKCFKPGTKPGQFSRRQLLNGLFDIFCGH